MNIKLLHDASPLSRCALAGAIAVALATAGCSLFTHPPRAMPPDAANAGPAGKTGVDRNSGSALWVVRFANEVRPEYLPTTVAVGIEDADGRQGGQFAFRAYRAVPGSFSEFLVRLDLPPGRYQLTRLFGVSGEGKSAPQFDFPAQFDFSVAPGRTAYLGRLEVTNRKRQRDDQPATGSPLGSAMSERAGFTSGTPHITANDASAEDLVSFRSHWQDLRERSIETRLPRVVAVPAPQGSTSPGVQALAPAPGAPSGEFVAGQALSVSSVEGLPAALWPAFAKFAVAKQPRAFAVGSNGAYGVATGGPDAIARALKQCEQRLAAAPGGRCTLYAVDDTVVTDAANAAKPARPADTAARAAPAAAAEPRPSAATPAAPTQTALAAAPPVTHTPSPAKASAAPVPEPAPAPAPMPTPAPKIASASAVIAVAPKAAPTAAPTRAATAPAAQPVAVAAAPAPAPAPAPARTAALPAELAPAAARTAATPSPRGLTASDVSVVFGFAPGNVPVGLAAPVQRAPAAVKHEAPASGPASAPSPKPSSASDRRKTSMASSSASMADRPWDAH
jgi:hypothetical protein